MKMVSDFPVIVRHQQVAPVDVFSIARDLGIAVYRSDLENGISGVLRKDNKFGGTSGYVCLVKKGHGKTRQRFTVAHEIAHFLLHRSEAEKGLSEDEFYRSLSNPLEAEANQFAADILMPWHLINDLTEKGVVELGKLAAALEVSKQALAIRLGLPYDQDWS